MKKRSIASISTNVSSGTTPLRSNPVYWKNGTIPWLKTEQLGERHVYDTNEKISEKALCETKLKLFPIDTISIALYGEGKTRGNVSLLKREMTTNQACCNIVIDKSKASPEFVYYCLKNQYSNLRRLSSGVRKNLSAGDIKGFQISIPDLVADQEKIAGVLSALDDKIELNLRINKELEEISKLLYDYWFVQFDFPMTIAQAAALGKPELAGQPYRTSGGKMRFCHEMNRLIPEGWKVGYLSNLCSTVRGVTYSQPDVRSPIDANIIPILRATNINNGIMDLEDLVFVSDDMPSEDQFLNKFDILIVMSSGSKAHVGKNALYCYNRKVAFGAFCSKIVPKKGCTFFVGIHLQTDAFKKYISNVCLGTSINNLTNGHITGHRLVIPAENQLQEFGNMVTSFYEKISCNHQQNQELSQLRDWLLPMLMNGQVTVG